MKKAERGKKDDLHHPSQVFLPVCVFLYVCVNSSVFFSSLFARGYREAGRRQSGIGGVMEWKGDGEKEEGKKGEGDRQIYGAMYDKGGTKTARETDKQAKIRGKASPLCTQTCTQNNRSDLSPLFLCMFILHLYPFIPPPTGSLILLLASLLLFCPIPPLLVFNAFSSFSCSSLQYTAPGGDSRKSNCLSISHQCTASRGSCPLKTMKVGLSAEPGI